VAKNPSGLPAEGQLSSAYDLALVAREGLNRPDFFEYANTKVINEYPGFMPENPGDPRQTFAIATQNPLFINGYDGAIGLKTGWTTEAGRTFVGAARRDGVSLVVTLMNIQTPIYEAAAPLLDWGFENIDEVTPVGYLVDPVRPAFDEPQPTETAAPSPDGSASPDGVTASPATAAAASDQGSSGWVWGLIAAMLAGLAMVIIGLRNLMRPPPPRQRRPRTPPSAPPSAEGEVPTDDPAVSR
jgi:D-alanyl-D-alanine carboxypeptidase (penicillin-binding protein 5/6)